MSEKKRANSAAARLPQPKFDLDDTIWFVYMGEIEVECPNCAGLVFFTAPKGRALFDIGDFSKVTCPICLCKGTVTENGWVTGVDTIVNRRASDGWETGIGGRGPRVQSVMYSLRHLDHGVNHRDVYRPDEVYEPEAFATMEEADAEAESRNKKGD